MSIRATHPTTPIAGRGRAASAVAPLGFDLWLAAAAAGLGVCSLVALHGAAPAYVGRQAIYLAIGFLIMALMSRFEYSRLREPKWGIYAALIFSILLVLALGSSANGATRSINLVVVSFQASELGKVMLMVFLAGIVVDSSRRGSATALTVRVMALALGPALLVIAEPDLGSGLVYLAIAFTILYIAGVDWQHLTGLAALAVTALIFALAVGPAIGVHVLNTYQEQRLTGFLHPSQNPNSHAFQQVESTIAIGAGQKTGRGASATQTSLGLVSESPTDFIFTVVGERMGFVGAAIVLSLYALMIWRTLRIVAIAKTLFGALIAAGAVAMLTFQVFVNVGMTVGIMPITGVTLPLMSYGGSSVLTTFLTLGLLQSIYGQARTASAMKGRVLRF
ncbi:MAG: FtsW/RodA/SpoVE family cell cycle protein [Solirubrobacteraceae bacterium]|jgi:rod shape determining protein RodA